MINAKKTALSVMLGLAILSFAIGDSLQLTETDNGITNSVKSGTEIVITLEGNPTTGYEWGWHLSVRINYRKSARRSTGKPNSLIRTRSRGWE